MTDEITQADRELLPLPKHSGKATDMSGQKTKLYNGIQMQDYARANVAHATAAKDAEIEALRAECTSAEENEAIEYKLRGEAEARTKLLAEALREIERHALFRGNGDLLQFVRASLIQQESK